MSLKILNSDCLPDGCVRLMRAYLQTTEIPVTVDGSGDGALDLGALTGETTLLGVMSNIEVSGATKNSPLVIICAQPKESWSFGGCFPRMPGAWEPDGNADGAFHLRFMTLVDPLWVFVYSADGNLDKVQDRLKEISLFVGWLSASGKSYDELGVTLADDPFAGPLASTLRIEAFARRSSPGKDNANSIVRGGLTMWGRLMPDVGNGLGVFDQLDSFLKTGQEGESLTGALMVKASVRYESPFPDLVVQMPPRGWDFGFLKNANVFFTSPLQFAAEGSEIGITGDFHLSDDKRIHVELDYPIVGDVIRANGKYIGGPEHLLGDSASFGLPGPAPSFGADTEISLELEFSKSRKTLTLLSFDLELREKEWILLPAPVRLTLEGLSFHVDVYDPLGTNRMVMAQIAAQAAFGDDSNGGHALQLVCGGSYPSGDLYLQASNTIPVGALLEKMVGPSSALEKLTVEDLRLEYNYRRKHLALQFDVPESWTIVKGFDVGNLQFRIQGGESYSGGLAASLQIAGVHVYLAALYDQGWQFEGSTGPGQEIAIGELLSDLGKKFGVAADHPAALESLVFKNLHVAFNSATRDFTFKGEADFDIQDTPVAIEVAVDIAHDSNGLAQKRFSGVITFSTGDTTHEFDVVFADEKMMLADQGQVEVSTLLAAYRSTAGDPPSMRDLAPSGYKDRVPDIKTRGAFLAKQWKKTQAGESSKWLIGLSLEAGLDLSNVQLPNLPLMGSGGPPKSLKLDLQILVPTESFGEADVAIISRLNTSGGVNVPSHAVEAVAVATVLLLDGQTVTLNLPIKANPSPAEGQAAFDHDPTPPAIKTPAVAGADQAVAVTPGVAVTADDTKWVKIQKNFGPIHIERVGLKYKEEKLFIFLDGGLTAAGFTVSLQGLGVDTPLTKFDPHFHLSGIGLDYKGGGVELGGAFLQMEMQDAVTGESYTAFAGQAVLKTEQLSLSAIGSFFKYRGESSLFVYALLEYPLGGPPFFFVTGLAAGFGYNRRAIVPPVEQIHTYPLVTKAIAGPAAKGAAGAKTDLAAELAALAAYVPPELGEIFLAVGVKFTSFELIDSFGLIIAQFGEHNQFDLVGVSHLQIPAQKAGGKPGSLLAEIYMNWEAKFHADEGVVGLSASLVPGSYIFSPDCHLTGGFAYYAWFGGEHAGDFVYTVGGYHPDFHKPDHYPIVAPLALNWFIEKANLSLKGQLYYALTAHAFMAGGKLDASIQGGFDIGIAGVDFSADLHIAADFLITWQPYHYDAAVKLDLNIAISAHLLFYSKSFSLNVGGDMHIWGPEFAGEARIYLKVLGISHALDVTFGAGKPQLRPITWEKFSTAFLPQIAPPADDKGKAADQAATPVPAKTDPHAICGVSVKRGLIRASGDRWVINAREFSLVTDSVIPINQANRGEMPLVRGTRFSDPGGQGAAKAYEVATDFGIAPMGVNPEELTTVHTIRMTRDGNAGAEVFFRCEPIFKKVPSALWDEPRFEGPGEEFLRKPEVNPERQLVSGVLSGLEVLPAVLLHPSVTLPVERGELQYATDRIADAYQWQPIPMFKADELADWRRVNETIQKTTETDAGSADREQPWQVRQRLLRELGLGGEKVIFGQPADQYALDAPQIEMV